MRRSIFVLTFSLLAGAAQAAGEANGPAPATPAPSGLSQSKFLGLLYSEIAKRTPTDEPRRPRLGDGQLPHRRRRQGRQGDDRAVEQPETCARSSARSSPACEAPPPPGGSFEGSQKFNFH